MQDSEPMEIIIVGLGAGGLYASKNALNFNRKANVTILERRDFDMYSPCGLPFVIEGEVEDFDHIKHEVPLKGNRIQKFLQHEVTAVDAEAKIVKCTDHTTGEEKEFKYDSLILATGAYPINLPIPGAKEFEGKGIHFVSDPTDSQALLDAAQASEKKYAIVVGGGAIGLEVAIGLRRQGLGVAVTKRTAPPFPRNLDPQMGEFVVKNLEEEGIRVLFGKGIDSVNGGDKVESVTIDGEEIPCDIVVMAVGMKPDLTLAEMAGCEINYGAVVTDNRMETSIKGIYAVGDLVQTFSRITEEGMTMQLATSAYRQGISAGINAAGGNTCYPGAINTFVTKIGKQEIASTGMMLSEAQEAGFDATAIQVKAVIKPHFMPHNDELILRAIVDKKDARILGCQAIGNQGATWRVNIFALAIHGKMTLYDLYDAEFAYNPPVSEMFDNISQLAEIGLKRLRLPQRECKRVIHPECEVK